MHKSRKAVRSCRMKSRIRYLAIVTEQPRALSQFYGAYFGTSELGTLSAGDISFTEGAFNLTFLKPGLGEVGLSHIGLAVRDIGEVEARLREHAPETKLVPANGAASRGEYTVVDPKRQSH